MHIPGMISCSDQLFHLPGTVGFQNEGLLEVNVSTVKKTRIYCPLNLTISTHAAYGTYPFPKPVTCTLTTELPSFLPSCGPTLCTCSSKCKKEVRVCASLGYSFTSSWRVRSFEFSRVFDLDCEHGWYWLQSSLTLCFHYFPHNVVTLPPCPFQVSSNAIFK